MHTAHTRAIAPIPRLVVLFSRRRRLALLCLALLLAGCGAKEAGGLTLTGSTSVTPFAEHLAEQYQRAHARFLYEVLGPRAGGQLRRSPPVPRLMHHTAGRGSRGRTLHGR